MSSYWRWPRGRFQDGLVHRFQTMLDDNTLQEHVGSEGTRRYLACCGGNGLLVEVMSAHELVTCMYCIVHEERLR